MYNDNGENTLFVAIVSLKESEEKIFLLFRVKEAKQLILSVTFLSTACFPFNEANNSKYFFLEVPNYGGHVGFITSFKPIENTWLEHRIERFIRENIHI